MFISSFFEYAELGGWNFSPRTRYVLSESLYDKLVKQIAEKHPAQTFTWSSVNSYERRYGGQDANGRRIIIYRETAYGDALIVTGLARYIKSQFPDVRLELHSMPGMWEVWCNNTDVRFIPCPPTFDSLRTSDYHILLEGMLENDGEPDQQNCYDNLFGFCGFHPFTVPAEFKRPYIAWGPGDDACLKVWKENKPWKYVLWHVCPSSPPRMVPPTNQEEAIRLIADKIDVVLVGRQPVAPKLQIEHERVHDWTEKTGNWRALIPMIREAECVVAPDSSVLHATAAFPDVPLVGLWGSYAPEDRAKYYTNHTAVTGFDACPFAPCRTPKSDFPLEKCRQSIGWVESTMPWCSAMRIPAERISKKVVELI